MTFSIAVLHRGKYSVIGMMVWSGEGVENSGDGGDALTIEEGDSVQHWKSRFEKNIFLRSLNVCLCIINILNDKKMS